MEANTLARAIGRRLREIRFEHGWTQEDVSAAARKCGLGWSRATVATIETGRRDLSAGELVALPVVLWVAAPDETPPLVELVDLIPDGADIELVPGQPAPPRVVRAVVASVFAPFIVRAKGGFPTRVAGEELAGEAEDRAALRLGILVPGLLALSQHLWGHSLTEERDRRVAERGMDISTESRRAIRGRVTRQLVRELEAVMHPRTDAEPLRAVREPGKVRLVGDRVVPAEPKARAAKAIVRKPRSRSKRGGR